MHNFRIKFSDAFIIEAKNKEEVFDLFLQQIKENPESLKDIFSLYRDDEYDYYYDQVKLYEKNGVNIVCWADNTCGQAGILLDSEKDCIGSKLDLVKITNDKTFDNTINMSYIEDIFDDILGPQKISFDIEAWKETLKNRGSLSKLNGFSIRNEIIHELDLNEITKLNDFLKSVTPELIKDLTYDIAGDYICFLELPSDISQSFGSRTVQPYDYRDDGQLQIVYDGLKKTFEYNLIYGDNIIMDNKYFEGSEIEKTFLQAIEMIEKGIDKE